MVVHFSYEQQEWEQGEWKVVARIDSSRSVHMHLWARDGRVLIDHGLIREIPPDPVEGSAAVNAAYQEAYDRIYDGFEENLRRWRHD